MLDEHNVYLLNDGQLTNLSCSNQSASAIDIFFSCRVCRMLYLLRRWVIVQLNIDHNIYENFILFQKFVYKKSDRAGFMCKSSTICTTV